MSKDDDDYRDYRRHAAFCRTMAEQAVSFESRAEWSRLAAQWQSLAELKNAVRERIAAARTVKVPELANS